MALKHAENPSEWIRPGYRSGPAGFEAWAQALGAGRANRDGHTYNYTLTRDKLAVLLDLHPWREHRNWLEQFESPDHCGV